MSCEIQLTRDVNNVKPVSVKSVKFLMKMLYLPHISRGYWGGGVISKAAFYLLVIIVIDNLYVGSLGRDS